MPTVKTPAERVRALRQRRAAAGLVQLRLYVHPDDREAIRRYAERLARKRTKEGEPPA
jgi:hypothetical protein